MYKIRVSPLLTHTLEVEASSSKEAEKIAKEVPELEEAKEQVRWQKLVRDYEGR